VSPARKLMASVFWDKKGVLIMKFKQFGTAIISEVYFKIKELHMPLQEEKT
jgi:hypothetical protein